MILNALAERLKRRAKGDFKGRHFGATLILQAVSWSLRYPLSISLKRCTSPGNGRGRRQAEYPI